MRWDDARANSHLWTRAALSAVQGDARALIETVPEDVRDWCPAYPENPPEARAAFWVGFMSALSKHESTYRPDAVGGDGRWHGLLQISPATARGYGCRATTGAALRRAGDNLRCAARIMAATVSRDGVIYGLEGRYLGVSADWGPLRRAAKRQDIAEWTQQQDYCRSLSAVRPKSRPLTLERG